MRKRVLRNVPHVRLSLVMLLTLFASFTMTGCGGGSSSNNNSGPVSDPTLATVTGIVTDTTASGTPVQGAVVSIAGTSLKATTGADGKFAIINVPIGVVGVAILTPSASTYYGTVLYGASGSQKQFDTQVCPLGLATQPSSKGTSPLPYAAQLYPAGAGNPPPPPIGAVNPTTGCPL